METDTNSPKKPKRRIALWIFSGILVLLTTVGLLLYYNFNSLLSQALQKSFEAGIISDVYELKFEKLRVNVLAGSIRVINVDFQPRKQPLNNYPYINSSIHLKTEKIILENVDIFALLRSNKLKLEKIDIHNPEVQLQLAGKLHVLFPFKDTTLNADDTKGKGKKEISAFFLKAFHLNNASIHVSNSWLQRTLSIRDVDISLDEVAIDQTVRKDLISFSRATLSLQNFDGTLYQGPIKHAKMQSFHLRIDSLEMQKTADTLIYNFADVNSEIKGFDIQTADSIFHLSMKALELSYKHSSLKLQGISFDPNVSFASLQKKFKHEHLSFSGNIQTLNMYGIAFDSLIYKKKIFIEKIEVDSVLASLFKDKTKPLDSLRFPEYPGQQIRKIPFSLRVKNIRATHVNLTNTEKKPNGDLAKVQINRGTLEAKNLTNLDAAGDFEVSASAFIDNKVPFHLTLLFSYQKPQFGMKCRVDKFNLSGLNPLLNGYTPASIKSGVLDELKMTATAYSDHADGQLTFLYHELDINLQLQDQAKWKSSVLSFAANTALQSSNPSSADSPPRSVHFKVDRVMNRGFINMVLKSVLTGLKETMIMSKENRKAFHEKKKKWGLKKQK